MVLEIKLAKWECSCCDLRIFKGLTFLRASFGLGRLVIPIYWFASYSNNWTKTVGYLTASSLHGFPNQQNICKDVRILFKAEILMWDVVAKTLNPEA